MTDGAVPEEAARRAVMDAGLALRPVANVVGYHAQPTVVATPAVPTELPAAKTVSPAAKSAPARNDTRLASTPAHSNPLPIESARPTTGITHDAIIDPQTNEI